MSEFPDSQKKPSAGVLAIKRRFAASKPVMDVLTETAAVADDSAISFLRRIAAEADGIITEIKDIQRGKVNEDLVDLSLDSSSVVYITILTLRRRNANSLEQEKPRVELLRTKLEFIQDLLTKILARGFFKKIRKHNKDKKDVAQYRADLEAWLKDFEPTFTGNGKSIQDFLEEFDPTKVTEDAASSSPVTPPPIDPQTQLDIMNNAIAPMNTAGAGQISKVTNKTGIRPEPIATSNPRLDEPYPPRRPDIRIENVRRSGIGLGSGKVTVINRPNRQ